MLLDRLLGVLSLFFDVLSPRLALLLNALDTLLSSRLHRLGSFLNGRLQALAHILRYFGGLLLDRLEILLQLGNRLPLLLAGRNERGHKHSKAECDHTGGRGLPCALRLTVVGASFTAPRASDAFSLTVSLAA